MKSYMIMVFINVVLIQPAVSKPQLPPGFSIKEQPNTISEEYSPNKLYSFLVEVKGEAAIEKLNIFRVHPFKRKLQTMHNTYKYYEIEQKLNSVQKKIISISSQHNAKLQVTHTFGRVWHGFSVRTTKIMAKRIAKLPEVERVWPAYAVRIPENTEIKPQKKADEILPPLGIPEIWRQYNITGTGVTIAIIDTGVDYTHPDLGGCFGKNCKVIGGYDFVNQDDDPKDDNNHGTHVAGIAAGNGHMKGVAPGANILAYKVLDEGGSGSVDNIIAAIERSVDPNQDGSFDDAVQIINMSLGGPGTSDDPLAVAVNRIGGAVTVVCAAGNSGKNDLIGTPAAAVKAIAVAASEGGEKIARFSSVGPTADFVNKPDIAAPGVNIMSTLIGGGYGSASGTSMASPYIAGIAALLHQQKGLDYWILSDEVLANLARDAAKIAVPDAQPDNFTAFFYRGHGLVQPHQVFRSEQTLVPLNQESLSQGPFDIKRGRLQRLIPLTFENISESQQHFTVEVESNLGNFVEVSPKTLSIEGGDLGTVYIRIFQTVDQSLIPETYPYSNGLLLKLRSADSSYQVELPVSVFLRAGVDVEIDLDLFDYFEVRSLAKGESKTFSLPYSGGEPFSKVLFLLPENHVIHASAFQDLENHKTSLNVFLDESFDPLKESSLKLDDASVPIHLSPEFYDDRGHRHSPRFISYSLVTPVIKSGFYVRSFFWSRADVILKMSQIAGNYGSFFSSVWIDNERHYLAGTFLHPALSDSVLKLGDEGYARISLEPLLPNIGWPKLFFHEARMKDGENSGGIGLVSLANQLYTAKENWLTGITLVSSLYKEYPDDFPLANPDLTVSLSLNNYGQHYLNYQGEALMSVTDMIPVGNSQPYIRSNKYLTKDGIYGISDTLALRYGEQIKNKINFEIFNEAGDRVTSGITDPYLRVDLKPGKYKLKVSKSNELFEETEFSIQQDMATYYMPLLNLINWEIKDQKVKLFISADPGRFFPSSNSTIVTIKAEVKKADGVWHEIPLESGWKINSYIGDFEATDGYNEFDLRISFSNDQGFSYVQAIPDVFKLTEVEASGL